MENWGSMADMRYIGARFGGGTAAQRLFSRLLWACVWVFLLQAIVGLFKPQWLEHLFALSVFGMEQGRFWTVLTYAFLHGGLLHLLFNLLFLYFIGHTLAQRLTRAQFLGLLVVSVCMSGLVWLAVHLHRPGVLLGASGLGMGLLSYYCCWNPEQAVTFLFIIFPVTLQKRQLLWIVALIELFGLLLYELPMRSVVANSAHIGGLLGGLMCYAWHARGWAFLRSLIGSRFMMRKRQPSVTYSVQVHNHEDMKREVDRILDKISAQGFSSLVPEERETLERARDLLRK